MKKKFKIKNEDEKKSFEVELVKASNIGDCHLKIDGKVIVALFTYEDENKIVVDTNKLKSMGIIFATDWDLN